MVNAYDYYPFGMMMPGRKFADNTAYRYGFNGKENDNDVKGVEGSQQDYGMRIYDPRLGKFLSVDPLTKSYAQLTPFQFASNSPIAGIDLDGGEFKYYALDWKDKSYTKLKLGNEVNVLNNISLTVTFSITTNGLSTTISIPITLDRSMVGLSGDFVNYNGVSVRLPEGIDKNNLPNQTDPIWETFQTDSEIDENFVGSVRQIVDDIQNIGALNRIVASGGFGAYLKKNGLAQKVANISYLRRKSVKDAWKQEKELIEKTGRGTRDWTQKEIAELKKTGKVKGYEGHHINNVADNPGMAGDPNNVKFVQGRKGHLKEHNGNFKNPTNGSTIDRKKLIEDYQNKQKSGG